jgi:hypothetical protein
MKMTAFIALMMEADRIIETSVYFNETTRRYIPEGCQLHDHELFNTKFTFPLMILHINPGGAHIAVWGNRSGTRNRPLCITITIIIIIAIALMMEAEQTSETSANFNVTTLRDIDEDSNLLNTL